MDPIEKCFEDIEPLIDIARMQQRITELNRLEENADFDAFEESSAYVSHVFASCGAQAKVVHFPADGRTKYHCWTAPIGYRTRRAICEIVEPAECAGVLGDRAVEPHTAVVGTGYTGPEGIEAEVIHATDIDALSQIDPSGKLLYSSTIRPLSAREKVAQGGGLGVISSFSKDRERNYDYVAWVNTWDTQPDGWLPTVEAQCDNLIGISISPRLGERLEACLAKGPVKVRIVTEGEYFEGELPAVMSLFPGATQAEVLLTGHLYEPGLVDNAAGVITSLSVSEILAQLSAQHSRGRFRRGLRHFHSQECYGVLALQQCHPEMLAQAFAHLNIDMVGRKGFPLILRPGLGASRGFSEFLMHLVLDRASHRYPTSRYEYVDTFQINCTILADPALGGIPTSYLTQENPEWHTSRDRYGVQELGQDELRFTTLVAAAWTYFLVTAADREVDWLLEEYRGAVERGLLGGGVVDTSIFLAVHRRAMATLAELLSPARARDLLAQVDEFIHRLDATTEHRATIAPAGNQQQVAKSRALFPKALVGGPAVAGCFTADQLAAIGQPKWSHLHLVLKAWADGTRSIYDITRLATYETGRLLDLGYTLRFFEAYAEQGIVSM